MIHLSWTFLTLVALDLVVTTLLCLILLKRYLAVKITTLKILFAFYIIDLTYVFMEFIFIIPRLEMVEQIYAAQNNLFQYSFIVIGLLASGIFLTFFNNYLSDKTRSFDLIVFCAIFFSYAMFVILRFLGNADNIYLPNTPISLAFLPPTFFTYLIIVSTVRYFRYRNRAIEQQQRRQLTLLYLSILIYYLFPSIFITMGENTETITSQEFNFFVTNVIPRIFIIIGDVFILRVYIPLNTSFLQFQNLEQLLVVSQDGIPVYNYSFVDGKDGNGNQDQHQFLISGGLTAIRSMLSETLQISQMQLIEFSEKQLLVENKDYFDAYLVVDRNTIFLKNALSEFSDQFHRRFPENTNKSYNTNTELIKMTERVFGV